MWYHISAPRIFSSSGAEVCEFYFGLPEDSASANEQGFRHIFVHSCRCRITFHKMLLTYPNVQFCKTYTIQITIHLRPLIRGWVAGAAAPVGDPKLSFPETTLTSTDWGIPRHCLARLEI